MRDLVGPPPCATRIREIRCSPRYPSASPRVAHPFLSRLASPRLAGVGRHGALASLASPWRRNVGLLQRRGPRRMAARRRRRRGARCPLDRRARRETPRSERPTPSRPSRATRRLGQPGRSSPPDDRRAVRAAPISPLSVALSIPLLRFGRGDARRPNFCPPVVSSAEDAPGGTAARLTHNVFAPGNGQNDLFSCLARFPPFP